MAFYTYENKALARFLVTGGDLRIYKSAQIAFRNGRN